MVAGLVVQLVAFVSIATAHSLPMLLISSALTAVGSGLYSPTLLSLTSKLSPPDRQGGTMGLAQSMSSLGRIAGPLMGGFAYDLWLFPHRMPFWLGAIGFVIAIGFGSMLLPGARRISAPTTTQ
jgi:MFS family permease